MNSDSNPEILMNEFSAAAEGDVTNSEQIYELLKTAFDSGKKKEFSELIFNARYVCGLKKILGNRTIGGDVFIEKTFAEFKKYLEKVIMQLKELSRHALPDIRSGFEKQFLAPDQSSMANVMLLIEDLSAFKHFLNETSRKI